MTRNQVRAAMRRMRDHNEELEEETGEINLVPYMDIVTNIIIFLLASVVNQVALGNINVSVPTIGSGGASSEDQPPPEQDFRFVGDLEGFALKLENLLAESAQGGAKA